MKKLLALLIAVVFVAACASVPAAAKILHQCHCCGGDGVYTCDASDCNNGKITCGRCGGTGEEVEKCADCGGTGKCRMCGGTGKRAGDPTIDCDNCKGSGKCQGGPGWGPCTDGYYYKKCQDCNGEGWVWHNSEWCTYARNHGGTCPVCKGTGYEGDGVEGTPNDGVSNAPRPGDGIYYLDGSYAVYGGSGGGDSSGGSGGGSSDDGPADTPANTPDEGPAGDEPAEPADETEPESQKETFPAENRFWSESRDTDFDVPLPNAHNAPNGEQAVSLRVEMGRMTEEQQRYFAGLSDAELSRILTNVQAIVASAEPGRSDPETDKLLDALAAKNGYESLPDGRLFPLYFDGHQEIGFPVRVSVGIEKGLLDGGTDLYVYHVDEAGNIERLGMAEYGTYEDGSVERIAFYTTSFSTFFTAAKELDLDVQPGVPDDEPVIEPAPAEKTNNPLIFVVIAVVVCAAIAVAVWLVLKRKAAKPAAAKQAPEAVREEVKAETAEEPKEEAQEEPKEEPKE